LRIQIKNLKIINIILFLLFLFISSLSLGIIINILKGEFSYRLLIIALINSLFLSLGVLLNIIFTKHLIFKINNFLIFILSFSLILGINIFGFIFLFIFDPFFFIYESNLIILYLIINFIFILSFCIITTGFLIYQNIIIKNEEEISNERLIRKDVELKLYTSKINPHFLFNSLNLMISLLKKPDKAEKALIALSELLRFTIDASKNDLIPINEEIDSIKKYLYIQKLRFEEKLNYKINCSIDFMIPPLILQPLVENSIKHNINLVDKLNIMINIEKEKNNVIIIIEDSCKKLKEDMIGIGTGLENTKKRVELIGGKFIIKDGGVKIILKL